jgi:hypothetical protein
MQESHNDWKRLIEDRLGDHARDIDGLKAFRNWVVGGASTVAFVIGWFSNSLKHLFGFGP